MEEFPTPPCPEDLLRKIDVPYRPNDRDAHGAIEPGTIWEVNAPDGEIRLFLLTQVFQKDEAAPFAFVRAVPLTDHVRLADVGDAIVTLEPSPDVYVAHCWDEGPIRKDDLACCVGRASQESITAVASARRVAVRDCADPIIEAFRKSLYEHIDPVYLTCWAELEKTTDEGRDSELPGRTIPFVRPDRPAARTYARAADGTLKEHALRTVILDASFLRACPADGGWLQKLGAHGHKLVLIDTLAFELFATEDPNQWPASVRKLAPVVDQIECWMHVSEMLQWELQNRQALREPCDGLLTEQFRACVAAGRTELTDPTAVSHTSTQREVDGGAALGFAIDACLSLVGELRQGIAGKPRSDVEGQCYAFVNDARNIAFVLDAGGENAVFADCQVSEEWAAWHHAKWFLAALCEGVRSEQSDRVILTVTERLLNRKHDGDYLVSLRFADAIASNETNEMQALTSWMYGKYRAFISSTDLSDQ